MTIYNILTFGVISVLTTFNCHAETAQPEKPVSMPLTYDSSLSKFKSINSEINIRSSNKTAADKEVMDHTKMSNDEMNDMDHSKMSVDEMKGMNHDNMTPEQMRDMPKDTENQTDQEKLESTNQKTKPAQVPADSHQNHQM